jgi:hypothetical protein
MFETAISYLALSGFNFNNGVKVQLTAEIAENAEVVKVKP